MSGALALAVRADCRARWRSMAVLAVFVAVAATAVLTPALMARRTASAFDRQLASVDAADVLVAGPDLPGTTLAETPVPSLAGLPGVVDEDRYVGLFMFFPGVPWLELDRLVKPPGDGPEGPQPATFALLDDPAGGRSERLALDAGRLPQPGRDDELFVSAGVAAAAGWAIGSTVPVEIVSGSMPSSDQFHAGEEDRALDALRSLVARRTMTVVGIGTMAGYRGSGETVVTTPALVAATNPVVQYSLHGVRVAPGTQPADVIAAASDAGLGRFSVYELREDLAAAYRESVNPDVASLWIFAAATGVVAVIVLGHALGREALSVEAEFDARRALGQTRAQLALSALARVALIVAVGLAVSAPAAVVLADRWLGGVAREVDPAAGPVLDPAVVVPAVAVVAVLLLGLAGSPIVGLTGPGRARQRPSTLAGSTARLGAPLPVVIGARHAFEPDGRRATMSVRSSVAVAIIAAGVASGAGVFASSLDRFVSTPSAYGLTWDVVAEANYDPQRDCGGDGACDGAALLAERAAAVEAFLRADPAVAGLTPDTSTRLSVGGAAVTVVGVGAGDVEPVVVGGTMPMDGEIALGPRELRAHGLAVGDLVPVIGGDGEADTLRVVGSALTPTVDLENPPGLGVGGIVSYDTAMRLAPAPGHAGFLVDLGDDSAFEEFAMRFRTAFAQPIDAYSADRGVAPITVSDYRRVLGTPVVLAVVLGALALATIGLALSGSLQRQVHDFAVLRALGASRGQLVAAVGAQGALVTVVVLAAALPLGLIGGRAAWTALEDRLGTVAGMSWPVGPISGAMAVAAAALGLSMVGPTVGLVRAGVARQLAGE